MRGSFPTRVLGVRVQRGDKCTYSPGGVCVFSPATGRRGKLPSSQEKMKILKRTSTESSSTNVP